MNAGTLPPGVQGPQLPWWRIRVVWLVIGGPAAVVVAGIVTIVMSVRGGDAPLVAPDSAAVVMRTLTMQRHVPAPAPSPARPRPAP